MLVVCRSFSYKLKMVVTLQVLNHAKAGTCGYAINCQQRDAEILCGFYNLMLFSKKTVHLLNIRVYIYVYYSIKLASLLAQLSPPFSRKTLG
jgi:hypothetical protein